MIRKKVLNNFRWQRGFIKHLLKKYISRKKLKILKYEPRIIP